MIAWANDVRYHVNSIRTGHNERAVIVTINGKVIAERVFVGAERLPMLKEVWRLQKVFNCNREG